MDLVRRGSLVLSTAPTNIPHPWKVDWARGEKFRCFLGRIYDPEVISTDEWEPERFPEGLSQGMTITKRTIQPKYLKKDKTSMNSKAYATPVKSGSVKIYTKSAFGRVTSGTAVLVDEEKGCAEWAEDVILAAERTNSVYFVLHKTDSKWMLSAVLEDDLEYNDIKIAVVKKRESASVKDWRLIQLWKSDLSPSGEFPPKPFTVEVTGGAADGKLYCAKGEGTMVQGQWQNSGYLTGISVVGFAVFPTGSMTWGASANEYWASNKGYVEIKNAASGGSDSWYVSLISNFDPQTPLGSGIPYLAVIAGGSDAETKTQPWGAFNGMPRSTVKTTISVGSSDIVIEDGLGGSQTINAVTTVSSQTYLNDYQCQKLEMAYIYWDSGTSSWVVNQYHTGDFFWPRMFTDAPTDVYTYNTGSGSTYSPPTIEFTTNNTNWFGTWTGYDKEVSYPTTSEY